MKEEIGKVLGDASIQLSEWLAAGYVPIRDRIGMDGRRYVVLSRDSRSGGE